MKTRKTFTNSTGVKIERLSRWIKVRTDYDITPRHSLWDYATDDMGNSVFYNNCDTDNVEVTYFIYDGRKYALDQFFRTSYPDVYKNGSEEVVLAGYDSTAVFNIGFYGISIETDECVEYVRVYREVKNSL